MNVASTNVVHVARGRSPAGDNRRAFATIVVWSLVTALVCTLLTLSAEPTPFTESLSRWMAWTVHQIYGVLGYETTLEWPRYTVSIDLFYMAMGPPTLAGPTLAVLSFFFLIYPARPVEKIVGWLVACCFLVVLNIARVVILGILGTNQSMGFGIMLFGGFPAIFVAAVILAFGCFVRWTETRVGLAVGPDAELNAAPIPTGLAHGSTRPLWTAAAGLAFVWVVLTLLLLEASALIRSVESNSHALAVFVSYLLQAAGLLLACAFLGALTRQFRRFASSEPEDLGTTLIEAFIDLPQSLRTNLYVIGRLGLDSLKGLGLPALFKGPIQPAANLVRMENRTTLETSLYAEAERRAGYSVAVRLVHTLAIAASVVLFEAALNHHVGHLKPTTIVLASSSILLLTIAWTASLLRMHRLS